MQTAMRLAAGPATCRMQRPMAQRLMAPAGLGGKARKLAGRSSARGSVVVRAGLEDALGAAADSVPSAFHNLAAHLTTGLFLLGDAASSLGDASGAASAAVDAASNAASALVDAAPQVAEEVDKNGGFFGAFSGAFEAFLKVLDGSLEKIGVPYSYGFAIILLTVLVKVATYPLTKQQVESTLSMQAMAPKVKELQAKYANDAERLQVETAKMYQTAGVNPLAGCLPSLATIPVFIGLYKALSNVADEGLLTEGFFWIPSLAGPTTVNGGLDWLFKWQNGAPMLGYYQTAAYLVLPILLVVSQAISQKVISPPQSQDPAQQQTQAILKFLPLMIGWFSLNVPSGLTLYWFTNNILTTAQQLYLRQGFSAAQEVAVGPASTQVVDVEAEEAEKRPSGKELNARRSSKQVDTPAAAPSSGSGGSGSRGEKFRAIRAREAVARASEQAAAAAGPAAAAPDSQPARGAKFQAIKQKEAAFKQAAQAAPSSNNGSNGSSPVAAAPAAAPAAQPEHAASPAATVVEAEVLADEEKAAPKHAQQESGGEVVQAEVEESGDEAPEAATVPATAPAAAAAAPAGQAGRSSSPKGSKGGKKKGGKKK